MEVAVASKATRWQGWLEQAAGAAGRAVEGPIAKFEPSAMGKPRRHRGASHQPLPIGVVFGPKPPSPTPVWAPFFAPRPRPAPRLRPTCCLLHLPPPRLASTLAFPPPPTPVNDLLAHDVCPAPPTLRRPTHVPDQVSPRMPLLRHVPTHQPTCCPLPIRRLAKAVPARPPFPRTGAGDPHQPIAVPDTHGD